jgi:hypothetical protein
MLAACYLEMIDKAFGFALEHVICHQALGIKIFGMQTPEAHFN